MKQTIVTVLSVEGDIFYYSCSKCKRKVEFNPDSPRSWCTNCDKSVSSPERRFRLSLRINDNTAARQITIFGNCANELFGATAKEFFSYIDEHSIGIGSIKQAVEKSLFSCPITIHKNEGLTVILAEYASPQNSESIFENLKLISNPAVQFNLLKTPKNLESLLRHRNVPEQSEIVSDKTEEQYLDEAYNLFFTSPESPPTVSTGSNKIDDVDVTFSSISDSESLNEDINECIMETSPKAGLIKNQSAFANSTPLFKSAAAEKLTPNIDCMMVSPIPQVQKPRYQQHSKKTKKKPVKHLTNLEFDNSFECSNRSEKKSPRKLPIVVNKQNGSKKMSCQRLVLEKSTPSSCDSYTRMDTKRGKRRCRVQRFIIDPPTQNSSISDGQSIRCPIIGDKVVSQSIRCPIIGDKVVSQSAVDTHMERGSTPSSESQPGSTGTQKSDTSLIADSISRITFDNSVVQENSETTGSTESLLSELDCVDLEGIEDSTNLPNFQSKCDSTTDMFDLSSEIDDLESLPPPAPDTIGTFASQTISYFPPVAQHLSRSSTEEFDSFELEDLVIPSGLVAGTEAKLEDLVIPSGLVAATEAKIEDLVIPSGLVAGSEAKLEDLVIPSGLVAGTEALKQSVRNANCSPPESLSGETVKVSPQNHDEDSDDDLFAGDYHRQEEDFEWSGLNHMSTQEISKHFDFNLSESDNEDVDKISVLSNQSEDLF